MDNRTCALMNIILARKRLMDANAKTNVDMDINYISRRDFNSYADDIIICNFDLTFRFTDKGFNEYYFKNAFPCEKVFESIKNEYAAGRIPNDLWLINLRVGLPKKIFPSESSMEHDFINQIIDNNPLVTIQLMDIEKFYAWIPKEFEKFIGKTETEEDNLYAAMTWKYFPAISDDNITRSIYLMNTFAKCKDYVNR